MTVPALFDYKGTQVRTITIDGEPWFVASDACAVLEIANPRSSLALLDDDEKGVHTVYTPGGDQQVSIINEPGLYSLILRSRRPEAKAFKRWVTHELIPAARRQGLPSRELSRLELIEMAHATELERLALEKQVAELEPKVEQQGKKIAADRPKVTYVEIYVDARKDTTTFTVLAKQLGLRSAKQLYEELKALGVIYQRAQGRRRTSKGGWETVLQWLPRAGYESWFKILDQADAPTLHNGQQPTTLYVLPPGKVGIAEKLAKRSSEAAKSSGNVTNLPARRDDNGGAA